MWGDPPPPSTRTLSYSRARCRETPRSEGRPPVVSRRQVAHVRGSRQQWVWAGVATKPWWREREEDPPQHQGGPPLLFQSLISHVRDPVSLVHMRPYRPPRISRRGFRGWKPPNPAHHDRPRGLADPVTVISMVCSIQHGPTRFQYFRFFFFCLFCFFNREAHKRTGHTANSTWYKQCQLQKIEEEKKTEEGVSALTWNGWTSSWKEKKKKKNRNMRKPQCASTDGVAVQSIFYPFPGNSSLEEPWSMLSQRTTSRGL